MDCNENDYVPEWTIMCPNGNHYVTEWKRFCARIENSKPPGTSSKPQTIRAHQDDQNDSGIDSGTDWGTDWGTDSGTVRGRPRALLANQFGRHSGAAARNVG